MFRKTVSTIMLTLLLTSMLTLTFNIQPVRAKTIVVPDDYPTIQGAIDSANEGDTVFVRNGVYYEHVDVDKSVSLVGESRQGTIVDGNFTGGAFCLKADRVNVTGFTMRNGGPGWPSSSYGICARSDGNNISHNIITNNYYGIWLTGSNDNTISDNDVTSNIYTGIRLEGSANNTVSNNNVVSNRFGVTVDSGGNYDLWSMNADGSNQTRLTYDQLSEYYPYWSPDGSKIACTSFPPCNPMGLDIWVMNPDGTNKTQITANSRAFLGGWSPDSSQMVYYSDKTGNWEIWVMNADGTNQRQLTTDQGVNYRSAWSPDGTKIAFLSIRSNTTGIWIMNPDGTEQVQLTAGIPAASDLSWSPDGSKIAFDSYDSGTRKWAIWIINRDGTNRTRLTPTQFQEASPKWSPDGAKIAYGGGDDWWAWDIWVMNADGTNKTRLTDNNRTRICSWSPDSSKLAFAYSFHVQSADNSIIDNTIANNQEVGMTISWDGTRNTVERNLIHSNGHGLNLVQANENVIINNTITNNTRGSYQGFVDCGTGIYLDRSKSNILKNNELADNAVNFLVGPQNPVEQGIEDYYVNDVDESNLVNGKPIYYWVNQSDRQVPTNAGCVLLVNSTNILVENLPNLEHNGFGVALYRTTNSTIRNVTASNNLLYGITLLLSSGNNLMNNTASDNVNGIYLYLSNGTTILNNTASNNANGILVLNSKDNILRDNVMMQNQMDFGAAVLGGGVLEDWINDVDESNTVEGKPVYYWVDQHDRTVPNDGGLVYLIFCSAISVKDMDISNNLFGVCMIGTYNSTVENVNVQKCALGFLLLGSTGITINNNTVTNGQSFVWNGITLLASDGIVLLMSNNNTVTGNIISNMQDPGSPTTPQEIQPPPGVGIWILGENNRVFHNNFVNNTHHALATQSQSNIWDDGYPSGGNYFDDYKGIDVFRSAYQNVTGSDGIGDAPYVIDSGNRDNYPLMKPYPWALHDLGVTSVSNSKTFVGQGSNMSLSVMLFNYGNSSETSNVQIYANSTLISSQVVVIAGGDSAIVSFLWNPEGLTKGNYTISAYVDPVSGEIDLVDNNVTGRWVLVTLLGDITGPDGWPDGKVDMRDVGLVARHFGEAVPPADPNWDVWQDWKIDMRDIGIVARHFGETGP